MKKIIKSLILGVTILGIISCEDFLDTSSPSEMTGDVVFNSTTYASQALYKVYADLTLDHTYGCRFPLNFSTNSDIEIVDALTATTVTGANNRGLSNYAAAAIGWDRIPTNWTRSFAIIENANIVIEGVDNSPLIAENSSSRDQMLAYKGEALGLRAMVYYDLIKNYGDVPMKLETTNPDGSNIYLGKTDRDTIMNHLIEDLKIAENILPWAGRSGYTTERITKGFVKGLRARIALARGGYSIRDRVTFPKAGSVGDYPTERPDDYLTYYKIAKEECEEIIREGVHQLNSSFEDEWNKINQLSLDNTYRENLYEVAHGLGKSGEIGYTIGVRFKPSSGQYTEYGFNNSSATVSTTAMYLYSFNSNDKRRDITVAPYTYTETGEVLVGNKPFSLHLGKWDQRRMGTSFLDQNKNAEGKLGYGINWIVMRYSDVLLMFAEAMNELESPDAVSTVCGLSAKDALKAVRNRAFDESQRSVMVENYVNNLSGKTAFFNALVDERAWEFGGEGIRKYDLIRWNLLSSKIEESKDRYLELTAADAPLIPATIYYKFKEDGKTIDKSSITWYEEPTIITGYESATGFGKMTDALGVSLGLISSGLNAVVPNRHLIPIGTTTIADSNGSLSNAYGY